MSTEVTVFSDSKRAVQVLNELKTLKQTMESSFFRLCGLMLEAQENGYHTAYGYGRFGDWVEATPELDMSERTAYYLINIATKARALGLNLEDLSNVRSSKLKEIFTLDPIDHREQMMALLDAAEQDTLAEVKKKVQKLRGEKNGDSGEYHHVTLKLNDSQKQTFDEAVELARLNLGDDWVNGEAVEPPISKCVEVICISFNLDPNNNPELREN